MVDGCECEDCMTGESQPASPTGQITVEDGRMVVLAWYWRWHSLYVEECKTVDAAADFLGYLSDTPEGAAIACIEVWDAEGYRKIESSEVFDIYLRIERERAEKLRQRVAANPPPAKVARLSIKGPDGSDADWYEYTYRAEAEAEIARLTPILGDRLVVEWLTTP